MSEESKEKDYDQVLLDLEDELTNSQTKWNTVLENLSKKINYELKNSIELSAEAISYRQMILEERTQYYYKIYRLNPKLKQLHKARFEYYSTKYQIKINSTEKNKLIDSDLAYHEAKLEFLQNYINFLTECIKSVDHVIWSVKNKIDFYNISGID